MLVKTKGIVFRTLKYGESSLILDIYTEELGLRSYIANGVRKSKSRQHAAHYQLMSVLDLVVYEQNNRDLNRIKEIKLDIIYERLPFEIERSSVGIFLLELCQKSIKEKEQNSKLFHFIRNWFLYLDQSTASISNAHLLFMVQLANHLGFGPSMPESTADKQVFNMTEGVFADHVPGHFLYMGEQESQILIDLIQMDVDHLAQYKIHRRARLSMLDDLINFYKIHVENFKDMNSLEILKEIYS